MLRARNIRIIIKKKIELRIIGNNVRYVLRGGTLQQVNVMLMCVNMFIYRRRHASVL